MRDTRGPDLILYGTSRLWLLRCYCCFCFCCRHASAATSSSRLTQMGMSLQGGIIGLAGNQIVLNVHPSVGARPFGHHSAEFWLVTPPTPSLTLLKTDDEQDPITTTGDGKGSGNVAALTNVTNLFRHGEDGFACVRSPSLLLAGKRLFAFVERWNYTGNHCYPKGVPPVTNFSVEQAAYQEYAFRMSSDSGKSWSRTQPLPLKLLAWNLQTVYYNGTILMHVKEKMSGHIWQISSPDLVTLTLYQTPTPTLIHQDLFCYARTLTI